MLRHRLRVSLELLETGIVSTAVGLRFTPPPLAFDSLLAPSLACSFIHCSLYAVLYAFPSFTHICFATERTYNHGLKNVVEVVVTPLKWKAEHSGTPVLSLQDISAVFCNVVQLQELSTMLLKSMQEVTHVHSVNSAHMYLVHSAATSVF
jgi:hypothetical protein